MSINKKVVLIFLLPLIFFIISIQYFIFERKVQPFDNEVRSEIKKVLFSTYRHEICGSYWENEMLDQYNENISKKEISQRLDYYLAILIYTDLDMSRAYLFVHMVGEDGNLFLKLLQNIAAHQVYKELDMAQKQKILNWQLVFEFEMDRINKASK